MAELFCTFCENRWTSRILDSWRCAACDYAVEDVLIQVEHTSVQEVLGAWKTLSRAISYQGRPRGETAYEFSYARTSRIRWDALAVLFDKTYISSRSVLLMAPKEQDRVAAFVEAGIFSPVFGASTDDFITAFGEKSKLYRLLDTRQPQQITDIYTDVGDINSTLSIDHLGKALACLDAQSRSLGDVASWAISEGWYKSEERTSPELARHSALRSARFHVARLNEAVVTAGLLASPIVLDQTGGRLQALRTSPSHRAVRGDTVELVSRFFGQLSISVPASASIDATIAFRSSEECREFRTIAAVVASRKREVYEPSALEELKGMFEKKLSEMNRRAQQFGNTLSVLLTGAFATAGSLMTGPAGAAIGGIGGSAVGIALNDPMILLGQHINRNWASYVLAAVGKDSG